MRLALGEARLAPPDVPIGAVVLDPSGQLLAGARNERERRGDPTAHAEVLALREAAARVGTWRLTGCTLYSNVEPCAMCSWPIRETGVSRVVFSITSPHFGGLSRWNVLGDLGITSIMRGYFRKPPQIVAGLLLNEAAQVWREWRPRLWNAMSAKHRSSRLVRAAIAK